VRVFLDSSVMIAAFWGDHADHDRSLRVFAELNRQTGSCAMQSVTDVYAAMTALPIHLPPAPEQALLFVEGISERLTIISLTEAESINAIRDSADRHLAGGHVYDALVMASARKSGADIIYTWDPGHFRRIAPDLADRIRTPNRATDR